MLVDKNGGDGHSYSRDFAVGVIECRVVDCPCNRYERCVMPSAIKIDSNGVCEQHSKLNDWRAQQIKELAEFAPDTHDAFCKSLLARCDWDINKAKKLL